MVQHTTSLALFQAAGMRASARVCVRGRPPRQGRGWGIVVMLTATASHTGQEAAPALASFDVKGEKKVALFQYAVV